ncbi:MAG: transcriptional regulator NrdR [Myxococcota bacterium]|nr:transcriptional regulator NrdR [Myxococcota bacterium]
MNCPFCKHTSTRVLDSRDAGNSIRRRRVCDACGRRFTTHERVEFRMPQVVKKDGQRVPFSREKVRSGFDLACRKRPVTVVAVEAAVDRLIQRVQALGEREIASRAVGRMVLDELRDLDNVAYLRFASVYQETASLEDFMKLLKPLIGEET